MVLARDAGRHTLWLVVVAAMVASCASTVLPSDGGADAARSCTMDGGWICAAGSTCPGPDGCSACECSRDAVLTCRTSPICGLDIARVDATMDVPIDSPTDVSIPDADAADTHDAGTDLCTPLHCSSSQTCVVMGGCPSCLPVPDSGICPEGYNLGGCYQGSGPIPGDWCTRPAPLMALGCVDRRDGCTAGTNCECADSRPYCFGGFGYCRSDGHIECPSCY